MHGDGVTRRIVPWPVLDAQGGFTVAWVPACGRRFWCPRCGVSCRVAQPGLSPRVTFGAAVATALLLFVAAKPLGHGGTHSAAHQLVYGEPLPASERARTGVPRWSSLLRWVRGPETRWPRLRLPDAPHPQRLTALVASFAPGGALAEVLDALTRAHAQGGPAM